jgi:hypothetical protein
LTNHLTILEELELATKNWDGGKMEHSFTDQGEQFQMDFWPTEQFADAFELLI